MISFQWYIDRVNQVQSGQEQAQKYIPDMQQRVLQTSGTQNDLLMHMVTNDMRTILQYTLCPGFLFPAGYPLVLTLSADAHGNSLLHLAVQGGHDIVVGMLLQVEDHQRRASQCASVGMLSQPNQAGETPIFHALALGHVECLKLLLDHNRRTRDEYGLDVYHNLFIKLTSNAIHRGQSEAIVTICKADPVLMLTATRQLYHLLHIATNGVTSCYVAALWKVFYDWPGKWRVWSPYTPQNDTAVVVQLLCNLWTSCEHEAALESIPTDILGDLDKAKAILKYVIARGMTQMAMLLLHTHEESLDFPHVKLELAATAGKSCMTHSHYDLLDYIIRQYPRVGRILRASLRWDPAKLTVAMFSYVLTHPMLTKVPVPTTEITELGKTLTIFCTDAHRHQMHLEMLCQVLEYYRTELPELAALVQLQIGDQRIDSTVPIVIDHTALRVLALHQKWAIDARVASGADPSNLSWRVHARNCRTYANTVKCVNACSLRWCRPAIDDEQITTKQDCFDHELMYAKHATIAVPMLSQILRGIPFEVLDVVVGYFGPPVRCLFQSDSTPLKWMYSYN
jgi:hypothetical protein